MTFSTKDKISLIILFVCLITFIYNLFSNKDLISIGFILTALFGMCRIIYKRKENNQ